ncbi:hypothetical protein [Streptomyces sp. NPDC054863]
MYANFPGKNPSAKNPPTTRTVYRAVLTAMAEQGPRKPQTSRIAHLADSNARFFNRTWPDLSVLFDEVLVSELRRLQHLADNCVDFSRPLPCQLAEAIVGAARRVREHPVTRAAQRSEPALLHHTLLLDDHPLSRAALTWLREILCRRPDTNYWDEPHFAIALFHVAAPFALAPSPNPPEEDPPPSTPESTHLDQQLSTVLHTCLTGNPLCANCPSPSINNEPSHPRTGMSQTWAR